MTANGSPNDFCFFDSISVGYNRRYLASQGRVGFVTPNYKAAVLDGFTTASFRVFDVTRENEPLEMTNLSIVSNGSTFGTTLPAARGRVYYAVQDSALYAPAAVVANDPAKIANPTDSADLIIISYKDFLTQANTWADYRRSQGFTVKVVNVDEIYDEFNYGVLSADSIKRFLRYTYTTWAVPPKYVMLMGDASYDPRNYEGLGFFDFVPTKFVDAVYTETGSDEYLADFDGDGLSEIAIGRVPARVPSVVTNVYDKTVAFEGDLDNIINRGSVFAYDLPNGYDFQGMSGRIRDQLPAGTPTTSIGRGDPNGGPLLLQAINNNQYTVNYSGHGTTGAWADSSFFSNIQANTLTNTKPEIFTMLTCLNGYFMNIYNESLAEVLLKRQNTGAVVAWASTGLTTADIQEIMAKRFYLRLGAGPQDRMGDLVKDAKAAVPGGSGVRLSWALLGDPMLKVKNLPAPMFSTAGRTK